MMPHVHFVHPLIFWLGLPCILSFLLLAAYYNTRLIEGLRKFYAPAGMILLDIFSPRSLKQLVSIWAHWILAACFLVTATAMPNGSFAPDLVRKGSVYVEFVVQVNNAMGDESDRKYHPEGDPGAMYQWGTRLDQVKRYIDNDFLPQLKGNKTGITTVEGAGYNMWDLTDDNESPISAFRVMLDSFTKVGSAPGKGANYASGFQSALDEFDLIRDMDKKAGDTVEKEYFIVLFADGNYSGDKEVLNKELAELAKRHVHLLIVGMGEPNIVDVPKYDVTTHQRAGVYEGQTQYNPAVLQEMQKAVPGADFIYAPPGTEHINYNFPAKSGGLYAVPHDANLYPWFVIAALLLISNLALSGGRLPRWRHIVLALQQLRSLRRIFNPGRFSGQKQKRL